MKSHSESFSPMLPFDHQQLMNALNHLSMADASFGISYLGESILGRGIPMITLGSGPKELLYVGAHHGMEWITSVVLTRWIYEVSEQLRFGGCLYGTPIQSLFRIYTVYVIPMLNPDGVEYQIHGVQENNPLYERVMRMNQNREFFSSWQANARGVDLNHNYDAGFWEYKKLEKEEGIEEGAPTRFSGEAPESEPEVAYLCNFIRFHQDLCGILTLHTQGEEIFYKSGDHLPKNAVSVARRIASISGYRLSEAEGLASFGGLTDWCVQRMGLPSFTLECGKGSNPLPPKSWFSIYARLREVFFRFPTMF